MDYLLESVSSVVNPTVRLDLVADDFLFETFLEFFTLLFLELLLEQFLTFFLI